MAVGRVIAAIAAGAAGLPHGNAVEAVATVGGRIACDRGAAIAAIGRRGDRGCEAGVDGVRAGRAGPDAAVAAVAEEPGVAAVAAGAAETAVDPGHTDPAGPAVAAEAEEPAGGAAGAAVRSGPAVPAVATVAEEPGRPAGPAGLSGCAGPAVAAVAEQQPTVAAGLPGARRPVGTVADQWAPQQRLGGGVDRGQHVRPGVGGLGAGIRSRVHGQGPHHLGVKSGRLRAGGLIGLGMRGKQRGNRRRHLVGGRRHDSGGLGRGRRIGRVDRRSDAGQLTGRRRDHLRLCDHKGHGNLPSTRDSWTPRHNTPTPSPRFNQRAYRHHRWRI